MTQALVRKRATYADLEGTPENMIAEILNGELVLSPRPAPRHANAASVLGSDINGRFHGPPRPEDRGGWWILDEPEIHLSGEAFVPDIAGWRRERMPEVPDVPWLDLAPDWVCEVASPSTQRHDRIVKSAIYLEAQVRWMWLVTPATATIEVLEAAPDFARWTLVTSAVGPEARRLPPFEPGSGGRSRFQNYLYFINVMYVEDSLPGESATYLHLPEAALLLIDFAVFLCYACAGESICTPPIFNAANATTWSVLTSRAS